MIDSLTLDQLRVLIAVAEGGSFSAAARRLGRVQSAISQSVQTLEATLALALFERTGKTPTLTPAGLAMLEEARRLVHGASALRARARSIAEGVEPELTLAVDPLFPSHLLIEALKALDDRFAGLPVMLLTEGLGAPEQRLRDGVVGFAIYSILATGAEDLEARFLTNIAMVPVVASHHPLAREAEPISGEALERTTQLVLTDRSPLTQHLRGSIFSKRIWRFADLATRLDYLLAGFGWCHMPLHHVETLIEEGRLKRLRTAPSEGFLMALHAVQLRGHGLGKAGRWLIDDLKHRLKTWMPCDHPIEERGRRP
jgi:DNA-binding transcriptional LysR family regulator